MQCFDMRKINMFFKRSPIGSKEHTKELKVLLDFSLTVKAAPHECVIRTGQP